MDSIKKIAFFDFDGTIYKKDSSIEFCKFYYKTHPGKIYILPFQVGAFLLFKFNLISTEKFKAHFFSFLNRCSSKEINSLVKKFWESVPKSDFREDLILQINRHNNSDISTICISAGPDFLVKPICHTIGINKTLATRTQIENGKLVISGKNCRGVEKLNRLNQLFKDNYQLVEAHSDNKDDSYLLDEAKKYYRY